MKFRIDRSHEIPHAVDDMVRWCRSAESRVCWPGASRIRYIGDSLYYDVAIRTPGLAEVTVEFEEQLGDVEEHGDTRRFESVQLWKGPSGELGSNWAEYTFTNLEESRLLFDFTLHYMLTAGHFDPVRYGQVSERTVDHYLAYLVQHIALFRSVEVSVDVPARPEDVVEFCRSPEARSYWPGVRGIVGGDDLLVYECGLAVTGIPDATLRVRERQGPLEGKGRAFSFEAEAIWVWPGGEVLNVWPTYRVSSASKRSSLLELNLRFVTPGRVQGEPLNRPRLDRAISTAAQRFLDAVAHAVSSRTHSAAG